MKKNHDSGIILNQIEAPAFFVQGDCVCAVNSAASQYHIAVDQKINDLIAIGKEEYSHFENGSLYLTVSSNGIAFDCTVSKMQNANLFVLQSRPLQADLQVLSLAAKQLSFPLAELSVLFDKAAGMESAEKERINKLLFQLQRITNNMSDAAYLGRNSRDLQTVEICAVVEEILEKTKVLLENTPIQITYSLPNTPIYAPAAPELLERAVYNLLSNAAKYGTNKIHAAVTQSNGKAYISISNSCTTSTLPQGMFTRYKRTPGIEDPRYGLGLGMSLVHTIAKAHSGTVLVETPGNNTVKVTMSLSLKSQINGVLRSPIIKPDIYGGRDRALIELSDVLPANRYE